MSAPVVAWPLGYLRTHGPAGDPVTALQWGLLIISLLVIAIIAALLVYACLRRRPPAPREAVGPEAGGLNWIAIGLALTVPVLLGSAVWTFAVLAKVAVAPAPALTIDVIAHRWWWEFRYLAADGAPLFTTANEIRIPVGEPVVFNLRSVDVIHSFWVPQLGGKTDVMPGHSNTAWLQADRAGVYRGQCAEFCGAQHAHMGLYVVAAPRAEFDAWQRHQQTATAPPTTPQTQRGLSAFITGCAECHTVRGTQADGKKGPDLTHLMTRSTLAATLLPLNKGSLGGWIANPQALKPSAQMPPAALTPAELQAMLAFLQTLD